jgi:SAM-dependent methyltransferase
LGRIDDSQAELWDKLYPHQHESCQYSPLHLWLTDLIRRELAKVTFSTLLDVGCGDGTKLTMLRPAPGCVVTGVDISPVAVAMAKETFPGGEFLTLDIQNTPLPGKYEAVICSEVLEHVEADVSALENIRKACAGTLVLTVPSGPRDATLRRWGHVRHYPKAELASKLVSAGFDIVKLRCLGFPFHTFYRLGLNLIPDRSVLQLGSPNVGRLRRAVFFTCYQLFKLNASGLGWQLLAVARPARSLH